MRTPCIVVKSKQYDMKDIAIDNWDGELAKKRMKSLIQTVGYGPNSERIDAIPVSYTHLTLPTICSV